MSLIRVVNNSRVIFFILTQSYAKNRMEH